MHPFYPFCRRFSTFDRWALRKQLNFDSFATALLTFFFCTITWSWELMMNATLTVADPTVAYVFWLGFRVFVGMIIYPILTGFFVQILLVRHLLPPPKK